MSLNNKFLVRVGPWLLFILFAASLMIYSNPLEHMPSRDSGVFLYGGQQLLKGKIPYIDFWDHKGPLIYCIDAFGLFLTNGSRWGVWLVEFGFLVFSIAGIYRIAQKQWGVIASLLGVSYWFYVLSQIGQYIQYNDSNYTETYSLVFNVFAVFFWLSALKSARPSWKYFIMGLLTGSCMLLRPNNIGIQISILGAGLLMALSQHQLKNFIKNTFNFASGVLTILALTSIWLVYHNAFKAFLDAVFNYSMYYIQKNQGKGFGHSYSDLLFGVYDKLGWYPFITYAILLVLWSYRSVKAKEQNQPLLIVLLIGLPMETVLASLSGRVFLHYVITWSPHLAWVTAALVGEALPRIRKKAFIKPVISEIFLVAMLILTITFNFSALSKGLNIANHLIFKRVDGIEAQNIVVEYVVNTTRPNDKVLVWGNDVWINFMTKREAPTKYMYQFPLFMPGYTASEKVLAFLNDLRNSPPALIVEPRTDTNEVLPLNAEWRAAATGAQVQVPVGMTAVFTYVDNQYCIVKKFHDTNIYRLKSDKMCLSQ